MSSIKTGLSATAAVLTVELPLSEVQRGQRPPAPLARAQVEDLAQGIAADLRRILGELDEFGLIVPGALYDLTEIIRPGLPMVEILLELYRGSLPDGDFSPHVLSLGADNGRFPVPAIAPLRRPGSGPLLALPFALVGEREAIAALGERLESTLLEQGRAEPHTEQAVRAHFGLQPENLAYATLNDLCAVLKVQLDHHGLGSLWSLLESALYRPDQAARVELPQGNLFLLKNGKVYTPYYSFEQWARNNDSAGEAALEGYGAWVRNQRLYTAGLEAHGLAVLRVSGELSFQGLCASKSTALAEARVEPEADFLAEPPTPPTSGLEGAKVIVLTEQFAPELGPLAYTVLVQNEAGDVLHFGHDYPLRPQGVHAIQQLWQRRAEQLGAEFHLARPGRITLSEDGRHLMPDLDTEGEAH